MGWRERCVGVLTDAMAACLSIQEVLRVHVVVLQPSIRFVSHSRARETRCELGGKKPAGECFGTLRNSGTAVGHIHDSQG